MDALVVDHLQFDDHLNLLVLDIFIIIENSPLIEVHHDQDSLRFLNNEKALDLFVFPSFRCCRSFSIELVNLL